MGRIRFGEEVINSLLQKQRIATAFGVEAGAGKLRHDDVFANSGPWLSDQLFAPGKYYTLANILSLMSRGFGVIRRCAFPRRKPAGDHQRFVEEANVGFAASELSGLLQVEVKEPLLHLYRQRRIDREEIGDVNVYFHGSPACGGIKGCA